MIGYCPAGGLIFAKSSRSIRINRDVGVGLSSGEKLIRFIFQLNVHLDYFQETDVILSRPAHAGENSWEFAKEELNNLASSTQFLVKL